MAEISPDDLDFAALIRPGDRVVVGQGTSEPLTLTEALVAQKDRLPPFEVFLGPTLSDTFAPDRTAGIRFSGYGAMARSSALARAGRLDVLPSHYSAIGAGFAEGRIRADVVLLQVSPPLPGRPYSLGLANDYVAGAARQARVVLAEVNPDAPWTHGAELSPDIHVTAFVTARRPPLELAAARVGDVERAIAGHVAPLVAEGATVQVGIGSIPDAVLSGLAHHRDLGIHSGVIGDGVLDLIEAGAVTNVHKPFDTGVTVSGALFGSRRLFAFAHDNPALSVREPAYSHGFAVLSRLPRLTAVNSAVEVDITGQVNAETAGDAYVGGVGGALDFARAANASEGGRGIIALPSTTRGVISRIVARVATVTIPRSDVDVIATEWGVAELRGLTLSQRARRMIAIAAPPFREELERAAVEILRAEGR